MQAAGTYEISIVELAELLVSWGPMKWYIWERNEQGLVVIRASWQDYLPYYDEYAPWRQVRCRRAALIILLATQLRSLSDRPSASRGASETIFSFKLEFFLKMNLCLPLCIGRMPLVGDRCTMLLVQCCAGWPSPGCAGGAPLARRLQALAVGPAQVCWWDGADTGRGAPAAAACYRYCSPFAASAAGWQQQRRRCRTCGCGSVGAAAMAAEAATAAEAADRRQRRRPAGCPAAGRWRRVCHCQWNPSAIAITPAA